MAEGGTSRGFIEPDWMAPLDVERRIAMVPRGATVKGMFFDGIVTQVRRRGRAVGRDRYIAFRGYPLEEWLELLPAAAAATYPALTPREGIRRFGQSAFDVFTSSTVGRVLMSMAGQSPSLAASLTPRAFDAVGSHGKVSVLSNDERRIVLSLSGMLDYIDAWHVGIYEGAMTAFGHPARVRVHMRDLTHGEIEITW